MPFASPDPAAYARNKPAHGGLVGLLMLLLPALDRLYDEDGDDMRIISHELR